MISSQCRTTSPDEILAVIRHNRTLVRTLAGVPVLTTATGVELPTVIGEEDNRLRAPSDAMQLPGEPLTEHELPSEKLKLWGVPKETIFPPKSPELPDFGDDNTETAERKEVQETVTSKAMMVTETDEEADKAGEQNDRHKVIVDTGCTSKGLMSVSCAETSTHACISIDPDARRRYLFANGTNGTTSSRSTFKTILGSVEFDILQNDSRVCLLGAQFLRESEAVIHMASQKLELNDRSYIMERAANGHLFFYSNEFFLE